MLAGAKAGLLVIQRSIESMISSTGRRVSIDNPIKTPGQSSITQIVGYLAHFCRGHGLNSSPNLKTLAIRGTPF